MTKRKRQSQDDMVLEYLQTGKSITPLDAYELFGITRLAAIVNRLRAEHNINTHNESSTNRFGAPVHYARYRMAVHATAEATT